MRLNLLISLACGLLLAACGSSGIEGSGDLTDACQLKPCVCIDEVNSTIFDEVTSEVLWRDDGSAYCPEGHRLELTSEE